MLELIGFYPLFGRYHRKVCHEAMPDPARRAAPLAPFTAFDGF
jgi:hypothetical protein